jgi:hypothetical protein
MGNEVKVFYCYSRKDEELREEIDTCLSLLKRQGYITSWHDRKILAGAEWEKKIDRELQSSKIVLLLVSLNFLASDYCYDKELTRAMEMHENGDALVVPVIVKPCDWQHTPFASLQAIPRDGKPLTTWSNRDEGLLSITTELRKAIISFLDSQKSISFESIRKWVIERGNTPHILVDAGVNAVQVPRQFVKEGKITLNISTKAVKHYSFENGILTFEAKFASKPQSIRVPITAILAVYGREDGQGIMFE